jgi:hypothetical protein
VFAQSRFDVPLTVSDGVSAQILYFGFLPGGHFCIDELDTINGHFEGYLPPIPPTGVFDARFVCPRSNCGLSCFGSGSPCDFRPFTSAAQRDTFAPIARIGAGSTIIASWPSGLSAYFTELRMGNINMLTDTSGGLGTIYSGGLVVSVSERSPNMSNQFALTQNYPNPFNPTTTIRYQLIKRSDVKLHIYDLLGQPVKTLVQGEQVTGGYSLIWKSDDDAGRAVSSGVYFYRLNVGGFVQTKKMLLQK